MLFRSRKRLVMFGLFLGACSAEPPAPHAAARNLLLVTFDTTRQDAVDGFGERTGVTPTLASLSGEAVRYANARTVAPITLPAHASILTGLYPLRHGVRANEAQPLPPEATTLAERLREAGFDTGAFVAAIVLDRRFGLDQGFDVYDQPETRAVSRFFQSGERRAGEVTSAAIRWLRERDRSRRFFLWVHYFDPHIPYDPSPEFPRALGDAGTPAERAYLAEVAQADAALGRLLDELRAVGSYDDTAIAIVADHGESLGEHGEESHASLCFDSTLRVPLILRAPGGHRAGEVSDEIVSVVDLFPTLLGLLGVPVGSQVDGLDLRAGPVPEDRGVYFESYYGFLNFGWSPIAGWARRGSKYLHASEPVAYHTEADPRELRPLEPTDRVVREARANIERLTARPTLSGGAPVDPEVVARLAALGYATGSNRSGDLPPPLAPSDLPSPMDAMPELERMNRADALLSEGRREEGIAMFAAIVRENPGNAYAQRNLATALENAGRTAEAAAAWERLIELGDASAPTRLRLAACLGREGEHERASALVEGILESDPQNEDASRELLSLAAVAERLGDAERARAYRQAVQRVRAANPRE